jgi:alkanesulfonate monooxygenase SsuD/methylene tetrahydromethanopterin reductase-like flavin-dependent oxidoreductase (luciferase family)
MFGVTQREHEARYDYAQEWIEAVKCAWGPEQEFDFEGSFIKLRKVRAKPKPFGGTRPLIMNAGASPTGRAFAIRNCDAFFTQASRTSMADTAERVKEAKDEARGLGRELDVYTVGVITCKPTQKEAEEYYRYCTIENADWSAVDGILGKKDISVATVGEEEFQRQRHHYAHGMGGLLMVGDPNRIAQTLADLSRAGLRGIGFSFVNYLKELPYFCDEVLPRLERMGVREKRR